MNMNSLSATGNNSGNTILETASGNNSARITLVPGGILIAQGAALGVCTTGGKSDIGNVIGM